jgi:hypothetical protein
MSSISHRQLLIAAGLCAAAMALASCATPPPPEGGVRIDLQNNTRPELNSVRVIDDSLAAYVGRGNRVDSALDVEGAYVSRTPTGFPNITVQIRNKTGFAIPLEARVSWYDAAGIPVDGATSWTRLFAQPQSMVTFQQTSIKASAAQYYVEIRGAQ